MTDAQTLEPVIDPDRIIVDPHHHLWPGEERAAYLLDELRGDTGSGHRVEATVFIECLTGYRDNGPGHLRCIGETDFVRAVAQSSGDGDGARISAIVGAADLRDERVEDVLAAHIAAGAGLFRGIRHAAAWDPSDAIRVSHHRPPPRLYLDEEFRAGFAQLAPLGLSFDAWLYHPQIPDLTNLARTFPETMIVLDHFGGPLGIGPYADRRAEVFADWRRNIAPLAVCPNVFAKLGGMAMPINGYGWHKEGGAPSSEAFVAAQSDYYRAAIDLFSPARCMFESNFPVDKVSLSYRTLWNAFKRLAAPYNEAEKDQMFRGTASRFYRLQA
ncbi:MAG TPA: amidohydrolase family protein [Caulobacteraceae bacterium]|nr:amidohydrolase family protein [Caulobacteraceae bacterium]